jgi:hypothetical protein
MLDVSKLSTPITMNRFRVDFFAHDPEVTYPNLTPTVTTLHSLWDRWSGVMLTINFKEGVGEDVSKTLLSISENGFAKIIVHVLDAEGNLLHSRVYDGPVLIDRWTNDNNVMSSVPIIHTVAFKVAKYTEIDGDGEKLAD